MHNGKPHFGVMLPQIKRPWVAAAEAAPGFEALGFDSVWVCDHLYGPQSPQLPILEAAQLGKVIATADNIAGRRVIAGSAAA